VSGRWCGNAVSTPSECTGDEVEYVELTAVGSVVTGQDCEEFERDCHDVQAGTFADGRLIFFYTFSLDRVDVALTLSGDTLNGTYTTTKAAGPIPITLHRIP